MLQAGLHSIAPKWRRRRLLLRRRPEGAQPLPPFNTVSVRIPTPVAVKVHGSLAHAASPLLAQTSQSISPEATAPGDKGVAVLPKILRFYLFSEGPHGARLPCFWSQSLVRSVHLRNPKGTICEVKFCPPSAPRESKSKEKGEVLRSRRGAHPKTVRHPATPVPVRRPHAGFPKIHGRWSDAGALTFQNLRRGSGKVGENTKRHFFFINRRKV